VTKESTTRIAVSLPRFDGPFDLLISLIRRNEYDIDALPVVEITSQFLAYVKDARQIDAELGGEFVEVASWLVLLKSRSLLPARDAEEPSPREELRRVVLDYQTLRAATEFLREREGRSRPGSAGAPQAHSDRVLEVTGEEAPTVLDVLEAARQAIETARAAASFQSTETANVTVVDQIRWVAKRLASISIHSAVSTAGWFADQPSLAARASLLLALLELSRNGFILLHQFGEFAPLQVKPICAIPEDLEFDLVHNMPAGFPGGLG
jgi:segregation and condensation protein A